MIDIENDIFTIIAKKLRSIYKNIYVTGEYIKSPSHFPCVSIIEVDNQAYAKTQTTDEGENHSKITYDVNVYSNKVAGKKSETKAILKIIDTILINLGFTRIMTNPIPNEDVTIYRIVAIYNAIVSKNNVIYRR